MLLNVFRPFRNSFFAQSRYPPLPRLPTLVPSRTFSHTMSSSSSLPLISTAEPSSTILNAQNTSYPQELFYGSGTVSRFFEHYFPGQNGSRNDTEDKSGAPVRAFIITGNSLATKTPLVKQVEELLGPDRHVGTFSSIRAHAPESDVDAATGKILATPDEVNYIISIGGGSPMDSSKVIAYRVFQKRYPNLDPARDSVPEICSTNTESGHQLESKVRSEQPRFLTHIAIPTTLAAAECSGRAGYTTSSGLKTGLGGPWLRPSRIVYDSTFLHNHTPVWLTLSTGVRALDHAVELFYHPSTPDSTREKCLKSAAKLFEYLVKYKQLTSKRDSGTSSEYSQQTTPGEEGLQLNQGAVNDEEARDIITQLQLASYDSLGYVPDSFSGPIGPSHSLGYALGSQFSIPHGVTSCMTLGPVVELKYKTDPIAKEQIDKMYDEGIKPVVTSAGWGARLKKGNGVPHSGEHVPLAAAIQDLVDRLGLRTNLTEYKVPRDKAGSIASRAAPPKDGDPVVYDGKTVSQLMKELVESLY